MPATARARISHQLPITASFAAKHPHCDFLCSAHGMRLALLVKQFPARQTVLIVCTQMTKSDVLTGRRRGEDVVDLDRVVGDDDAINEQFDQLAALVEAGLR